MTNIRRKFEKRLSQKQDTLFAMPGVMGDFSGQVDAGTPGMVYVQVAQTVETALCLAVPRVAGLLVWVGYTPHQPDVLQVLGQRVGYGTSATQPQPGVGAHAASHEYLGEGPLGGTDVVKVKLQQFMPLRVFPAGGLTIGIYPGIVRSASSYVIVADTNSLGMPIPKTIDLWMDLPAAGNSRYVLISIDVSGAVIATLGAEVTTALLAITDIPAPPADTQYVLAAVRLWDEQQTIVENRESPDIVDLRYPIMHYHQASELINVQLDNLGDVVITTPANGQVIFYDQATAKWVNGTLAAAGIAPAAKGVTNGDNHDHFGGDGAQIAHANLSGIGTNNHAALDTFVASKAQASGLASLDANSLVVQNPANATATPAANKIIISDANGTVDKWLTAGSWINLGLSATYVSATSMTITGDYTAFLKLGTKIRLTNSTPKYGYILSSSYSAPYTTVNFVPNTSYSLANAAITNVIFSYAEPPDFPIGFNFAVEAVGLTSPVYSIQSGTFNIAGHVCKCAFKLDITSWSGQSGYVRATMPVTPNHTLNVGISSYYREAGSANAGVRTAVIVSPYVAAHNNAASDAINWEASSRVIFQGQISYDI